MVLSVVAIVDIRFAERADYLDQAQALTEQAYRRIGFFDGRAAGGTPR